MQILVNSLMLYYFSLHFLSFKGKTLPKTEDGFSGVEDYDDEDTAGGLPRKLKKV